MRKVGEGKIKESTLLYSGFWGLSRHFNYVGAFFFFEKSSQPLAA
jgi:protein-S-isoprenylcysteine O-methyltransferase Ste14